MSTNLHFYTKYSKEKIKLSDKPFASGGEGALFPIASPRNYKHLVVKIYHPDKRTPEREAKMEYLLKNPPITFEKNQHPSIGWVVDLLYKNNRFVGIIMLKLAGKKLTKLTLSKLPRRADEAWKRFAFGQSDAIKLRLRTCFNIAVVIHQIHSSNQYVIVDLKPDNVLMQPNGLISIVDMDSVEVIENGEAIFSAPVATPEYTPPEHYTQPRTTIEETWDRFSLGVIFYQLLFGLHPFAASANPPYDTLVSLDDKIRQGLYVHHSERKDAFKVIPPPHKRFYEAPVALQHLFQNCFEEGETSPHSRPSAVDWCIVLADLLGLPFTHVPNINIPPSDLYFLPSAYGNLNDLAMALPVVPTQVPNFVKLQTPDSIYASNEARRASWEDSLLVNYKEQVRSNRKDILINAILMFSIAAVLSFFFPLFLPVALIWFLSTTYTKYIEDPKKMVVELSKRTLGFYVNNVTSKVDVLNSTIKGRLDYLKAQAMKVKSSRSLIKTEELNLVDQYFENRAAFENKFTAYQTWSKEADILMKDLRKKELETYKTLNINFQKSLKNHPRFKAYNFHSFTTLERLLASNLIQEEIALKKLDEQVEEVVKPQFEKAVSDLNKAYNDQLQDYKKERAQQSFDEFEDFVESLNNQSQAEKEYDIFVHRKEQLEINLNKEKKKALRTIRSSFQKTRKNLRLDSEKKLTQLIQLYNTVDEQDQPNAMFHQCQKNLRDFQQKIKALNIDDSSLATLVDLLDIKLADQHPNIDRNQNKKFTAIENLHLIMIRAREDVAFSQKEISKSLQTLLDNPDNLIQNPIDFAYWVSHTKEKITALVFELELLQKIQIQFYENTTMAALQVHLNSHKAVEIEANQKIAELEKTKTRAVEQLEERFQEAIVFKKTIAKYQQEQEKKLVAFEQEVSKKEIADIEAYEQKLQAELLLKIKTEETAYLQALKERQNLVQVKRFGIQKQKDEIQENLDFLELTKARFDKKIIAERTVFEKMYQEQKRLAEQKYNELKHLLEQIERDDFKVSMHLQAKIDLYKKIAKTEKAYQKEYDNLEELQQEKIKLDTLLELEKSYDKKIFIKDMLFDRVEQFNKNNTQK